MGLTTNAVDMAFLVTVYDSLLAISIAAEAVRLKAEEPRLRHVSSDQLRLR